DVAESIGRERTHRGCLGRHKSAAAQTPRSRATRRGNERYFLRAFIRLFLGLCSSSASPSASSTGGTYIPKRPRSPFLSPYQPPTGFLGERAQASTVPSAAGCCSPALPSGIP